MEMLLANALPQMISQALRAAGGEFSNAIAIREQSRKLVAEIEARRDVITQYLRLRFAERATAVNRMFDQLDEAFRKDDLNTYAAVLGAIDSTLRSNVVAEISQLDKELKAGTFSFSLPAGNSSP